jgi:hypothetical protein
MDSILQSLLTALLSGGQQGLLALLVAVVTGLLWDRHRLLKDVQNRTDKLDTIIDNYYKANLMVTEALNGLKIVLAEINVRLLRK